MRDRKFHVPQFEVGTPARFVVTNLNHEQPCLKELNDFGAEFVAAPHCRNKHHFLISRDAYLVGLKALPRKHSARKLMFRELSNNSKNFDDVRRKTTRYWIDLKPSKSKQYITCRISFRKPISHSQRPNIFSEHAVANCHWLNRGNGTVCGNRP